MTARSGGLQRSCAALLERGSWPALIATLSAAVALRFVGLDHLPGLNGDEAFFPVHAAEWRSGVPWSELRTGTDLPMNPVFFGLVAALQGLLRTSFWTVRLAALLHSLLAVAFGFAAFLNRGRSFAALFALLLAVLPVQLGYARLAWDPSAVTGVLVLALAAATRGRFLLAGSAFALSLWVHPAAIFAGPALLAALLAARWPRTPAGALRCPSRRQLAVPALLGVLGAAAGYGLLARDALPPPVRAALSAGLLERVRDRATDGSAAMQFAKLYGDFLSGPTIYRYITGSMPDGAARLHLGLAGLLLVAVVLPGLWVLPPAHQSVDRALAFGLLLSLGAAYLFGGLPVLTPHTERYGIFLVAPSCYVIAACLDAFARTPARAALVRCAAASLGALLLLSFHTYFLRALRHADPERHNAFRTGAIDPKQKAFEAILATRAADRLTLIRAEDWWIYWPVRYLAGPHSGLHVTIAGARWNYRFPQDFEEPALDPANMEVFGVAWAGSPLDADFAAHAQSSMDVEGYEPGPILRVYRLPIAESPQP
jgi:hypothetical protein